jgi:Tol biopolymer transport system component
MKRPAALLSSLVLASALALVASPPPASAGPSTNTITGRVSVLPGPTEPQFKGDSTGPIVSGSGRYVVFTSKARLSPLDRFDFEDVYLRDLLTDQVELISAQSNGNDAVAPSYAGAVSSDGRFVVFSSLSNALVPGDTNNTFDVFIRDRQTKTTERVSINSSGQQGTASSPANPSVPDEMDVSDNGRYVGFATTAPEFGVGGDVNVNMMVRDRQTNTTESVNVSSDEVPGNRGSRELSMSPDGRYVAFSTGSFNFGPDNNKNTGDIYLRDRTLGTTTLVSKRTDGTQSFNVSFDPSISDDGTKVAFVSRGDMTPGDLTSTDDVFIRNVVTNTTTKVSVDFGGGEADQHAEDPEISGDGTTVAWRSFSGEYISGGGNGKAHIFRRVGTNPITRESVTASGALGNGDSTLPSLSTNGKVLVFDSASTNLVTGDTGNKDVFVRRTPEVGPHTTTGAYATAMAAHFTGGPNPSTATTIGTRIFQGASPERQVLLLADGAFGTKRAPLVRLYVAYFKRLPDTGGLTYWLGKRNEGMTLDQVSAKFAASNEFKTKYGNTTNSAFTTLVYQNVLDRNPDGPGLAYWVTKLDGGMSRGTVMTNFSESSEGKRTFRPQVHAALVSLALLGKIGPTKLMTAVIDYMKLDSSERGVQRLIEAPEYAAAL